MAMDTAVAAIRVVQTKSSVPSVAPLMPARCVVSVERKEVRAPAEFSSLSKNAMS